MTSSANLHLVLELKSLARSILKSMYRPPNNLFVFTMKKRPQGAAFEGLSRRYTAIALLGLACESDASTNEILRGQSAASVCRRLADDIQLASGLGDIAVTLWASHAVGLPERKRIISALEAQQPLRDGHPTVEVAWALKALCVDGTAEVGDLRDRLARRLIAFFNREANVFPHWLGSHSSLRSHVSCFADQVYPIQALSGYHAWSGDRDALEVASRCAERICELQGEDGQWWWHYHSHTGRIIEGYPVYSVHQYGMAPMALFELRDAGGPDYSEAAYRGLQWMRRAPEINASLIDREHHAIWRKVDRTGPGKFCRSVKAAASRLHAGFHLRLLDQLFPPRTIDYECRPYCMGWLLYAWPESRLSRMNA